LLFATGRVRLGEFRFVALLEQQLVEPLREAPPVSVAASRAELAGVRDAPAVGIGEDQPHVCLDPLGRYLHQVRDLVPRRAREAADERCDLRTVGGRIVGRDDGDAEVCAELARGYAGLQPVAAWVVLPVCGDRRVRDRFGIVRRLPAAQQATRRLGHERERLAQVGRIAARQDDAIPAVDDVAVSDFHVQVGRSVVRPDDETDRTVGSAQCPQGRLVQWPVVEIAIDLWAGVEYVHVKLFVDTERVVSHRELLAVLRQRTRDGAGETRKHLLLARAQGDFGFANELAAGPGQHQRQHADEEQLALQVHLAAMPGYLVAQPAVAHAVHRFDGVEVGIDGMELATDTLDVRRDRVVVEHGLRRVH
jgi:hypothetical protein